MKNYSKTITNQPQTQSIFGRTDMIKNNAGGFSFRLSSEERLERFLIIGSEGGTYYANESQLTLENATEIVDLIKLDGRKVLDKVVDVLVNNKAPKVDPGLFVLALVCTYGDSEAKKAAYNQIVNVCKTSTHLFTFVANVNSLRGWSRGLRKGVSSFYTLKDEDKLAYQMVKYQNRAGFTHKDVLRLAHPVASSDSVNDLFKWVVGKTEEPSNGLVKAFLIAKKTKDSSELISLVKEFNLTWEMIPTESLNDPKVLTSLIEKMPDFAILRNLNRFSYTEVTKNRDALKLITNKLSKVKAHPVNILNTMNTYSKGQGNLGSKTWTVEQNIVDALDTLYYKSIENIVPTGKKILVAVDVSGSMDAAVAKSSLTARDVAASLSMSILRSEPNSELMWFDTNGYKPSIGRRSSLTEILQATPHGGGTDCSIPIKYAIANKLVYDSIVILTDSETWAGNSHALTLLTEYRKINPNVKVVEVASTANGVSNFPKDEKNLLRVVGFDATAVDVINRFLKD